LAGLSGRNLARPQRERNSFFRQSRGELRQGNAMDVIGRNYNRGPAVAEPLLAVVIIARNEARHIGACVKSVLAAVARFDGTRVLVIDSDSEDDTAAIAASYPVEVYRYRDGVRTAAAGRRVGAGLVRATYVLFVDGDSLLEASWLPTALARLHADPRLALVTGRRCDVFERADGRVLGSSDDAGFGGTALYRFAALQEVGGFDPYLTAEEEGELIGRLTAAGYRKVLTTDLMITHFTPPRDTWGGARRRLVRGMPLGSGQVLRVALRHGLFGYHARRFNRQLATAAYIGVGVVIAAAVALGASLWFELSWIGLGAAVFLALWWRHGNGLRSALSICGEWVVGACGTFVGFLRPARDPRHFAPTIEVVRGSVGSSPARASEERA
jgi:cellulose synthase/poly-beta-1,6-N-acetylglucosamine synthase-like glycosyltransferase